MTLSHRFFNSFNQTMEDTFKIIVFSGISATITAAFLQGHPLIRPVSVSEFLDHTLSGTCVGILAGIPIGLAYGFAKNLQSKTLPSHYQVHLTDEQKIIAGGAVTATVLANVGCHLLKPKVFFAYGGHYALGIAALSGMGTVKFMLKVFAEKSANDQLKMTK